MAQNTVTEFVFSKSTQGNTFWLPFLLKQISLIDATDFGFKQWLRSSSVFWLGALQFRTQ
ncbi:MAG TPA: hypothetical protein DEF45_24245 [Rhodopirellula sp.]|nr:hypothetical protein [Rhodopirellula sp.]